MILAVMSISNVTHYSAKLEINFYHHKAGQLHSMVKFAIKQADKGHHEGITKLTFSTVSPLFNDCVPL